MSTAIDVKKSTSKASRDLMITLRGGEEIIDTQYELHRQRKRRAGKLQRDARRDQRKRNR